jgi:hypothetical protein
LIKRSYDLSPEFGINRIKVLEVELYHYLSAKNYEKALEIYTTVQNHPRFPFLKGTNAEIWKVYAGYFHLLSKLMAIDDRKVIAVIGNINTNLIDYSITEFKKEKGGMNIPVLMLPVLTGTLEGQIEGHVRTKEALAQYAKRYLKEQLCELELINIK